MTAPLPSLDYHLNQRPWQTYTGIYTVFKVTVSDWGGQFLVYVSGPLRKKDGTQGSRWNTITVDLTATQPDWLQEIIDDARRRLS